MGISHNTGDGGGIGSRRDGMGSRRDGATSLVGGDDSYETSLADGDYNGDMEGFTTD